MSIEEAAVATEDDSGVLVTADAVRQFAGHAYLLQLDELIIEAAARGLSSLALDKGLTAVANGVQDFPLPVRVEVTDSLVERGFDIQRTKGAVIVTWGLNG